jgi:hypothetical protein
MSIELGKRQNRAKQEIGYSKISKKQKIDKVEHMIV